MAPVLWGGTKKFCRAALLVTLALGLLLVHHAAEAQQTAKVVRIGLVVPGSRPAAPDWKQRWPLVEGLRALGWVEGQNIVIEDRWAEGNISRLPELAAALVRLKVDVIVTLSWPAAVAAKNATATIPIVIFGTGDPVGTGLVQSLAHPGGNVTGLGDLATELSAKRLQLLKEVVPRLSRVAVLWNSADDGMTLRFSQTQIAAPMQGGVREIPVARALPINAIGPPAAPHRPFTYLLMSKRRRALPDFRIATRTER